MRNNARDITGDTDMCSMEVKGSSAHRSRMTWSRSVTEVPLSYVQHLYNAQMMVMRLRRWSHTSKQLSFRSSRLFQSPIAVKHVLNMCLHDLLTIRQVIAVTSIRTDNAQKQQCYRRELVMMLEWCRERMYQDHDEVLVCR